MIRGNIMYFVLFELKTPPYLQLRLWNICFALAAISQYFITHTNFIIRQMCIFKPTFGEL